MNKFAEFHHDGQPIYINMDKFIEFNRDGQPIYINKERIIYIFPGIGEVTYIHLNDEHTICVDEKYEEVKKMLRGE